MDGNRLAAAQDWMRAFAGAALDAVMPPQCLVSGEAVARPGDLSPAAWARLTFLDEPCCAQCGVPFAHDAGAGALCAACVAQPPAFERARAVLRYDDASKGMILAFKHGDRTDAAPAFGQWMARAGAGLLADADVIAPVPLHRWRLLRRRFNQSALLARRISQLSGVEAAPLALERVRATPTQGGLSADGRRRNVQGAFAVREGQAGAVAGRRVVLVDDVYTTGATLSACARALRRAGARAVTALALARVVKAGAGAI